MAFLRSSKSNDVVKDLHTGSRNIIINGGMQVWERGTSNTNLGGTEAAAGYYTADRWTTRGLANAENWNGTQHQVACDGGALLAGHTYAFKITTTEPEASLAADEELDVAQIIEAHNLLHLAYGTAAAKPMTLSFWVKSSVTGNFAFSIYQADGTRDIGFVYTITAQNTYEKKIINIPGDVSGSIDNNTGQGLYLRWYLCAGSNFTSSATGGAWASSTDARSAYGHAGNATCTTDNATWEITGVQLEVGTKATAFDFQDFADERRRCRRYYEKGGSTAIPYAIQYLVNGSDNKKAFLNAFFEVRKRAVPTVKDSYNGVEGNGYFDNWGVGNTGLIGSFQASWMSVEKTSFYQTTSVTEDQPWNLTFMDWEATAELT